jgi:hypothetical protein
MREEWKEIYLGGSPRLIVGWREPRSRLNAYRVKLHQDIFGDLAALCRPAVGRIQNYSERAFENFSALDDGEYYWYAHAALPTHGLQDAVSDHSLAVTASIDMESSEDEIPDLIEDDTADLVRLIKSVDALQEATRDDLDEGGYSFYAICWPHRGSMIGFVSRINPLATLKPGFRYFQFGNAMTTAVRPDFALREGADLVVGDEGTAILSPFSFEILLGDVGVRFDRVDEDVTTVKKALTGIINLTSDAEESLRAEASRTRSGAKRLRLLPGRLEKINLNIETVRRSLVLHGVEPDLLFDANGNFSFTQQGVGMFFDVIEGRYFEDDLGGERRRADRYSTR